MMRVRLLLRVALVAVLLTSCSSNTLTELRFDDAAIGGLSGVQARITFTDDDGKHPDASVDGLSGPAVDVPLQCRANGCSLTIAVPAGTWATTVTVSATDRCGTRADVLRFEGTFVSDHWQPGGVTFNATSTAFDVDSDDVIDVLEATTCARFDLDDGQGLPRFCDDQHAACCTDEAALSGGQMTFAGRSDHVLPYDRTGDDVDDVVAVSGFALDATEFTYGALARCVAAGVCLPGQAEHPARAALADGVDPRLPVQGLTPAEAATACAYFDRRLPLDAEWDFAAADRGDAPRGQYPFDVDAGGSVGCGASAVPAAAYQASGVDCGEAVPVPVGTFASSAITRGVGTPVSDMAGNVAEWTVIGDANTPDDDEDGVPDGVDAVVLRGGGVTGFAEQLENDFVLLFDDAGDFDRIKAVSAVAGFRCAADADVADDEPECPVRD
jgi:formylglycine-generating enzyme required for sulfatase activity